MRLRVEDPLHEEGQDAVGLDFEHHVDVGSPCALFVVGLHHGFCVSQVV